MRIKRICVYFMLAIALAACTTVKKNVSPEYQPYDYTESDALYAEIGRIEKLREQKPVEALWRARIMRDTVTPSGTGDSLDGEINALFDNCFGTVVRLCTEAAANKKYASALRFYRSLQATQTAENSALAAIPLTEAALYSSLLQDVPGYNAPVRSDSPPPMSTYINGTVTVVLDLGLKVERGMGYANSALGSGFFIDKRGYIITNYHVIESEVDPKYEGFSRLYIKLAEDPDTKIPAKVIGWDPILDLALIKAEIPAPYVFKLGSSVELDPGDRVFAIGSPIGLDRTLTSGIVSAVNRKLFSVGGVMQIDAAVNSGNSGGPLIDSAGNVQAVVFAGMLQYEGLNFAIPVEYLISTLPQLYQGGKREQSWVGGFGRTYRDADSGVSGIEVQYTLPGGSLARSSIAIGDIITAINGRLCTRLEDLQNALIQIPPDTIVRLDGIRKNETPFSAAVYLADRPLNPGLDVYERDAIGSAFTPIFGMELVPIAPKKQFSISKILKGSIADESGFSVQDPVDIQRIWLSKEKDAIYAELYTKKRKNGYFDVSIRIPAPLDSPYYF